MFVLSVLLPNGRSMHCQIVAKQENGPWHSVLVTCSISLVPLKIGTMTENGDYSQSLDFRLRQCTVGSLQKLLLFTQT